jgi:hypothetical protein
MIGVNGTLDSVKTTAGNPLLERSPEAKKAGSVITRVSVEPR